MFFASVLKTRTAYELVKMLCVVSPVVVFYLKTFCKNGTDFEKSFDGHIAKFSTLAFGAIFGYAQKMCRQTTVIYAFG